MANKRVNMDLDKELWRKVGIFAATEDMQKKEVVEKALESYISKKDHPKSRQ